MSTSGILCFLVSYKQIQVMQMFFPSCDVNVFFRGTCVFNFSSFRPMAIHCSSDTRHRTRICLFQKWTDHLPRAGKKCHRPKSSRGAANGHLVATVKERGVPVCVCGGGALDLARMLSSWIALAWMAAATSYASETPWSHYRK